MHRERIRRFHCKKAQGSVEYIVLFGALLIIAFVVIGALDNFQSPAADIRSTISETYWSTTSPFAIYDHTVTTDGILTLVISNEGPKDLRLEGVYVRGVDAAGQNFTAKELRTGRQIERKISLGRAYQPYQTYELDINLTYADADAKLPDQLQKGKEPIIGHCLGLPDEPECGGLLCNGQTCQTPNECQSHHCHPFEEEKICMECNGNGHCEEGEHCVNGICQ